MKLSPQTQLDMYSYIQSDKFSSLKITEGNIKDFLINEIKNIIPALYRKAGLFEKITYNKSIEGRLNIITNYNCLSNQLICYVLNDTKLYTNLLRRYDIPILANLTKNIKSIPESGSNARIHLIKLCKMYLQYQQLEITSKEKEDTIGKLEKESTLAELTLHRYSQKELSFTVPNKIVKKAYGFAQSLKTDIILESPTLNKTLIIDVKVYKKITDKDESNTERYAHNHNRFQLNSYIGAYLENHANMEVQGIILHLVSPELWEKTKGLDGANLTIESDRPIHLHIIPDNGLESIFNDYTKIVNNYLQ